MASLLSRVYWTAYLAQALLGQTRYPYASLARIEADRDRRVRRMVAYAYRWVPYYRETMDRLGLAPKSFRAYDDLRRLPLISVVELQAEPERFRSRQFSDDELVALSSSSSTGHPHVVWHDLATLYQNIGHARREQAPWPKVEGQGRPRRLSIGSSISSGVLVQRATRANALWPRWVAPRGPRLAAEDGPQGWIESLVAHRPHMLSAYGTTISQLAAHERLHRVNVPWPPMIRYSATGLEEPARRWLTEERGVAIFSGYQAIEAFKMGFECEAHTGYHVSEDLYPLRIVDEQGQDCAPGVTGEVVLSNLVNRGTVLLNYRMGDLASRVEGRCPCQRNLPRISYVQGRAMDILYDVQGRPVSHMILAGPAAKTPGILEWQARQTALDRITVSIVPSPACNREQVRGEIVAAGREHLGEGMRLEVEFVDHIERTAAGKLRYIINELLASDV